ncbi:MAG: hypothetical protein AAGF73_18000 [Actinomycetota bacterium]
MDALELLAQLRPNDTIDSDSLARIRADVVGVVGVVGDVGVVDEPGTSLADEVGAAATPLSPIPQPPPRSRPTLMVAAAAIASLGVGGVWLTSTATDNDTIHSAAARPNDPLAATTSSTPPTSIAQPSTTTPAPNVNRKPPVRAVSEPGPNPILVYEPGEFDVINPLDDYGPQDWSQVGYQMRDALPNRPFPVIQTEPIDIYEPGTYILTGSAPGTGTELSGVSLPPEVAVGMTFSIDMPNAVVTRTGDTIHAAVPLVVTDVTWPVRNVTAWLQ